MYVDVQFVHVYYMQLRLSTFTVTLYVYKYIVAGYFTNSLEYVQAKIAHVKNNVIHVLTKHKPMAEEIAHHVL